MGNTNEKESPRNRLKEAKPLMKNKRQFSEKENKNIVQNEISSQRKIPNQFKTCKHFSNDRCSQFAIKRRKSPSLRFIKGLNSLNWTNLYEGFSQDFKHVLQIKALRALKLRLINTLLTKEQRINSFKHIKKLKYLRNIQIDSDYCDYCDRMPHKMINFPFTSLKHCINLVVIQLNF